MPTRETHNYKIYQRRAKDIMDIHDIKKKGGTLLFSYNKISFSYKKQKNKVENDIILSKNVGGNYMSKLQEMRYKEVKPEETTGEK